MSAKYSAYSLYKEAEYPWIKSLPQDWVVTRAKFCGLINPSKADVRHLAGSTKVSFLPMEAIGEQGELDLSKEKRLEQVLDGYTYVGEGDICIAKITPCFENGKGAVLLGLKNGIAFATTEIIPLRCSESYSAKFMYYLLTSAPFNKAAEGSMYGAGGQKRVSDNYVRNYHLASPNFDEQQKIANFLDHETAKIDTLIEKQQQLIKLLKEKRQAVISHSVTKGLNPDAPMRDSGVEWLGEVPAHWGVVRIDQLFADSNVRADTTDELGYPILSISIHYGISDKELTEEELERKPQRIEDKSLYKVVRQNYLAYNMMRAWEGGFGAAAVSGLVSPAYVVCTPKTLLDSNYFELLLRTSNAIIELKRFSKGITSFRLRLYWDEFKTIRVPVPPANEIIQILKSIGKIDYTYKKLDNVASRQISLLKERRTALISAAVTGKIDVRNWQPPESSKSQTKKRATS